MAKAIYNSYATGTFDDKKLEIDKIAISTFVLHLSDMVLRKMDGVKSIVEMWSKLEQLYLIKSIPDCFHHLQQIFSFHMDTAKGLDANLDDINWLILSLVNCTITFSDEHKIVILFNYLSDVYK